MTRLLIIGAGPIGLEAALAGHARGFDVALLERDRIGSSLLRWGRTRFFTPFEMNVSPRLREVLGDEAPAPDALLSGVEFVQLMNQAASRPPLAGRVFERHEVVAVGRTRLTRKDMPNHPIRRERGFSVLVDTPEGEKRFEADRVLDASGCQTPTAVGTGGVPAMGERAVRGKLIRYLGDLEARLPSLAGKRILMIGHGHSSANAISLLEELADAHPKTTVTWVTRSMNKKPVVAVADDPLPERARIVDRANELAMRPPPFLTVERRAHVETIEERGDGFFVRLSGDRGGEYDAILGFTGYRPDLSFVSELPIQVSAITEGAAGIERALSNVTDCLSVPKISETDLASGEPGFHLIGHKSYGRSSTFLLKDGLDQLETILDGSMKKGD